MAEQLRTIPVGGEVHLCRSRVGARGFEPLTSSVSGKRSPTELSARVATVSSDLSSFEAGTGIEPVWGALQAPA
jgi:hypothetical protein